MIEFSYFQAVISFFIAVFGGGGLIAILMFPHTKKKVNAESTGLIINAASALVDDLNSEVKRLRAEMESLRGEVGDLRVEVKKGYAENALWLAHVEALENHINAELGPPPPARPYLRVSENID